MIISNVCDELSEVGMSLLCTHCCHTDTPCAHTHTLYQHKMIADVHISVVHLNMSLAV